MPEQDTQATAPEPQPVPPSKPARLGLGASIALLAIVLVTVGGLAFAAGRITAPAASSATGSPACSHYMYGPRGNALCLDQDRLGHMGVWLPGRVGGRDGTYGYAKMVSGTVQAVDSSSITVELGGGRTLQIATDSGTVYRFAGSSSTASASDVKVGATVTIGLTGGRTPTAGQVIIRTP